MSSFAEYGLYPTRCANGKGSGDTSYQNEVKQFIAQDVSALEQLLMTQKRLLDDKHVALEAMRAQLQTLQGSALQVPQVMFFEGQEGLKKIYLSMMRQATQDATLYLLRDEFVWKPEWKFVFAQEWHERVKRLKKEKNISTKLLINPSKEEKRHQEYYASRKALTYRFLSKKYAVESFGLYILGDMVSILSMEHGNLVGIHLTNKHLAKNFKEIFEGLWH